MPIRLTGQDSERGMFAHRHAVLHDVKTGETYAPIQHVPGAQASFEVHNSPLSETACLGFEYGYSITESDALVIWEAQFGDFANGAQVVIDQFIASGRSKWGQTSRLTLFLPHGYEGNGPEHSSARLERFLQLTADDNMRIANVTTPAQHYHLLRDQALRPKRRPLVVMTPKGLLRMRDAASSLDDLLDPAGFRTVIDDPGTSEWREDISRLVLCTGRALLRPPAPRRPREGRRGRDRARRAAVPVPDRGAGRAARELPRARDGRLGAGGAAQHGRVALAAPPPRGRDPPRRRGRGREPARGVRARPRATRATTRASRTASCAPRSASPTLAWARFDPTPPSAAHFAAISWSPAGAGAEPRRRAPQYVGSPRP